MRYITGVFALLFAFAIPSAQAETLPTLVVTSACQEKAPTKGVFADVALTNDTETIVRFMYDSVSINGTQAIGVRPADGTAVRAGGTAVERVFTSALPKGSVATLEYHVERYDGSLVTSGSVTFDVSTTCPRSIRW